jgi:Tol biopolymer transport system component
VYDPGTQTTQVWIGDITRGVETRLTSAPGSNAGPVWSPDSARVAFQSDRKHQADIYVRRADGSGADVAVTDEEGQKIPSAWSSDGRFVIAFDREPAGNRMVGISAFPLDGDRKPLVVVPRRTDNIGDISLSPDRRWLAYDTSEGKRREVYVVSFPDGRDKVQISNAGGLNPKWTKNGRELLYLGYDRRVLAVAVDTTNGLRAGSPVPLFQLPEGPAFFTWDASSDGQRILAAVPVLRSSAIPLSLVQNWAAGIRR